MPWRDPPETDFEHEEEYRWPFWEVGVDEADLFGDLHERFNTVPMFIQEADAFHRDVCEIARCASSKEDFYARLQCRRDDRLDELKNFIGILTQFSNSGYFDQLNKEQRFACHRVRRCASLDCLVAFIASFLGPNKRGKLPSEDEGLRKKCGQYAPGSEAPTTPAVPTPTAASKPPESSDTPEQTTIHTTQDTGQSHEARKPGKRRLSVADATDTDNIVNGDGGYPKRQKRTEATIPTVNECNTCKNRYTRRATMGNTEARMPKIKKLPTATKQTALHPENIVQHGFPDPGRRPLRRGARMARKLPHKQTRDRQCRPNAKGRRRKHVAADSPVLC